MPVALRNEAARATRPAGRRAGVRLAWRTHDRSSGRDVPFRCQRLGDSSGHVPDAAGITELAQITRLDWGQAATACRRMRPFFATSVSIDRRATGARHRAAPAPGRSETEK